MCSEKYLAIHIFSNKEENAFSTHSMWQTNCKINFISRSKYQEKMIFINLKQIFFTLSREY